LAVGYSATLCQALAFRVAPRANTELLKNTDATRRVIALMIIIMKADNHVTASLTCGVFLYYRVRDI
jgi:hypothetical protein